MKDKEIFRYSFGEWTIIGYVSEWNEITLPKEYQHETSYWISILISNKSVKKHGRDFDNHVNYYNDGRMDKIPNVGVNVLYDLIDLFKKWVEKDKPKFLAVGAYHDKSKKKQKQRYFLYDKVLTKLGYKLYYIDSKTYDDLVLYYCKEDLQVKSKIKSLNDYFDSKKEDY